MTDRPYNVLFLCTGNSARSIMAEAILKKIGGHRFRAFSAGSHPAGRVETAALDLLERSGYDWSGLRSKSWDEFAHPQAPALDFVFTVCDRAAGEECPTWPGQPITAHWGILDPAGSDDYFRKAALCLEALHILEHRIRLFTALPVAGLDRLALQTSLDVIGRQGVSIFTETKVGV